MKKIVILAVALSIRGTFAALVMDDTKEFFEGGAMLPGSVASCPSPSLRTAAVLPEIYGALSAWMERTFLLVNTGQFSDSDKSIKLPGDMKTAYLGNGYDRYRWDAPYTQALTNRVVTSRLSWWPLVNTIADSMKYGPPGATYGGGAFYIYGANSSTALGGQDFPTIDWTDDLIGAVPTNRWFGIWPAFDDCPVDGVWKTDQHHTMAHPSALSIMGSLYYGPVDYSDLFDAIREWKPISCLDMLRGKIGDGAYSLTNRSVRLDRDYLTALENALGLCDTYLLHGLYYFGDFYFYDLTYICANNASATVNAGWSFNSATRRVTIRPEPLTWTVDTYLSTVTNNMVDIIESICWCGGSTESAELIAEMEIPLTLIASNVYEQALLNLSNHPDSGRWTVASELISGGGLVYELSSSNLPTWYLTIPLSNLTGTNTLYVGAHADQINQVRFCTPEVATEEIPLPIHSFFLQYGFVDHIDVALGLICESYDGYVDYRGGVPQFPSSSRIESSLEQFTMPGTIGAWDSTMRQKISQMPIHERGHVTNAIGGDVASRSDMLPLSQNQNFVADVLDKADRVTEGGEATVEPTLMSLGIDKNTQTLTIELASGTATYSGTSATPVQVGSIHYSADEMLATTNGLSHVSAAAARVSNAILPVRAVMRWRNCRFEAD